MLYKSIILYNMSMGQRIKALRKERGMTLQKLAEKASLYKSNISDIENEKRFKPNIKTLEKIATAMECEVGDFFERSEDKAEMAQGLKDLLEDNKQKTLLKITEEEIDWMKSIRFSTDRKPTKETYVDILYTYRRLQDREE